MSKKGCRLVLRHSNFQHPKSYLSSFVESHPFNCSLQILLPTFSAYDSSGAKLGRSLGPPRSFRSAGDGPGSEEDPGTDRGASTSEALKKLTDSQKKVLNHISDRHYTVLHCSTSVFLDTEFIERHVRAEAAQFCALSVNTPADRSDTAAVLPEGRLVLSVSRETHERLGLVGARALHDPGKAS